MVFGNGVVPAQYQETNRMGLRRGEFHMATWMSRLEKAETEITSRDLWYTMIALLVGREDVTLKLDGRPLTSFLKSHGSCIRKIC